MHRMISALLLTLVALPSFAQTAGSGFKPSVVGTQPAVVTPTPAPVVTPAVVPAAQPGVLQVPGQPNVYGAGQRRSSGGGGGGAVPPQISSLIEQFMKNGRGENVDEVPDDVDWNTYTYPDNFNFYGGKGLGNIGDGLCTGKNTERSQVKAEYCKMLSDILTNGDTCASRELSQIVSKNTAIEGLGMFCPTFGQLGSDSNKKMFYMQLLAGLITKESGWNPKATEGGWYKNGQLMQGKGLCQIGNWDTAQDSDCAGVGGSGIYDPKTNMKCCACIALKNLNKDSAIGHGSGDGGARGIGRYFAPFRSSEKNDKNRRDIAGSTSAWCKATTGSGGGGTTGSGSTGGATTDQ